LMPSHTENTKTVRTNGKNAVKKKCSK